MRDDTDKTRWRARVLAARRQLDPPALTAAAAALERHVVPALASAGTIAAYVPVGREPGSLSLLDALHAGGIRILLPVVVPNGLNWAAYTGPTAPAPDPLATETPDPLVDGSLVDAPPVDVPPIDAPPGNAPPVAGPPGNAPPVAGPPGDAPPLAGPPGNAPPGDAPPVAQPPGDAPLSDGPLVDGPLVDGPLGLREPAGPRLGPDAVADADVVLVPALAVDHAGTRLGRGGGYYDRALARVPAGVPVVALLHDGELVDALPADPWDRPVTAAVLPATGWVQLPAARG